MIASKVPVEIQDAAGKCESLTTMKLSKFIDDHIEGRVTEGVSEVAMAPFEVVISESEKELCVLLDETGYLCPNR